MRLKNRTILTLCMVLLTIGLMLTLSFLVDFNWFVRILGWVGLFSAGVLVVQGFWKSRRDEKFVAQLLANPNTDRNELASKYSEARIYGWRVVHILVAVIVTLLGVVHGVALLPNLASVPPGVLLGVVGFIVLLVLGASGVVAERRRRSRVFGLMKKVHLWLMVGALGVLELHTITVGSTIARLGIASSMYLFIGAVGLLGAGTEYASLRAVYHALGLSRLSRTNGSVDQGRRAVLQKLGTFAVGTLIAVTFAEIGLLAPKFLTSLQIEQTQIPQLSTEQNARGLKLGNLASIPLNSAYLFTFPKGKLNLLIRLRDGALVAYGATCTHAPCTVGYDSGSGLIHCPCHGAIFDPAQGAAVLRGPATLPLSAVRLTVDPNGDIWVA